MDSPRPSGFRSWRHRRDRSRWCALAADYAQTPKSWPTKEWLLDKSLRIDDDVAETLYSSNRPVPTYTKTQITPLKNNYNGATPTPAIFRNAV
ncbi:MAG: hypothetical protein C5B58_09325 [Acidobacteria bacterium]|nr:MAG: hypothetical protein C5B58_09325 [Acidobacteriota bacterium]